MFNHAGFGGRYANQKVLGGYTHIDYDSHKILYAGNNSRSLFFIHLGPDPVD